MNIFDLLKPTSIDREVEEFRRSPDAFLLDVRTPQEYKDGHIPGSINIPLNKIYSAEHIIDNKDAKLFVYCLSGGRSGQACMELESMGYSEVKNIGGIGRYTGERVR